MLEQINLLLGIGTIALQILTAALLVVYLLRNKNTDVGDVAASVKVWALPAAFLVTVFSAAMSQIHSLVYGLPPCDLCWWQRILFYPLIVIFGLVLWRRTAERVRLAVETALVLSTIGLLIALYHHVLQMYPSGGLPCPSQGVSCAQIFFLEFGYITYPMMGITLFAFLIVLMLFVRESDRPAIS